MNRFALVALPALIPTLTACYPYYHKETRVPEIRDQGAQLRPGGRFRPRGPAVVRLQEHAEEVLSHGPQGGVEGRLRDVHQERFAEDREVLPGGGIDDGRDGGRGRLRG